VTRRGDCARRLAVGPGELFALPCSSVSTGSATRRTFFTLGGDRSAGTAIVNVNMDLAQFAVTQCMACDDDSQIARITAPIVGVKGCNRYARSACRYESCLVSAYGAEAASVMGAEKPSRRNR
jgi:hypothetical protein